MYQRRVSFTEAVSLALSNYFNFRDRAQRSEYWWFIVFTLFGSGVLGLLEAVLFDYDDGDAGLLSAAFSLFVFIPSLSVGWRRLHDINRSGWWLLLPYATLIWTIVSLVVLGIKTDGEEPVALIVIVFGGFFAFLGTLIWIIVMLARDSDMTSNRYGPSVKYDETAIVFA